MDLSSLVILGATQSPAATFIPQHLTHSHTALPGTLIQPATMLSSSEKIVIYDSAENESTAPLSAAATTLNLRDRMDDTEALNDCCPRSQDPVRSAEDPAATSKGDRHSSEGFAEVEGQRDCNVDLKNDDSQVDKMSKSASESHTSIPETQNSNSSPQSRSLLKRSDGFKNGLCFEIPTGIAVEYMEAGQERVAGARPKRKPTTKRRRSPRDHHAIPLQSAATGIVKTTVSVPNLLSRPPPAVSTGAKQNAPSATKTQATGTCATSRCSDLILTKNAALCTDLEPTNTATTVSHIAGVPGSCSIEELTSAGRHKRQSMPGDPAMGFLQSAVGVKHRCTRKPRKQSNKQGTRQEDKATDPQDKNAPASTESSRISLGVARVDDNVQDPVASCLGNAQTARTPESDRKAGSRKTSVLENANDQIPSLFDTKVSNSVWRRSKRKKGAHGLGEKKREVNESVEVLAQSDLCILNRSPSYTSSPTIIHHNNRNHPNHSPTISTDSTDQAAQAKHIKQPGTMSNAGSTRGHGGCHRGRDHRRSSNTQALPDAMVSGFPSQRTPSVGSSRRRRGFQPDEVNKNKELIEPGDRFNIQGTDNAENLTAIDKHLKASDTTNKLASTMTPNSPGPLAPHRRSQAKDNKPTHHPIIYTQAATMDASRPELDPVHFGDVSKPVESETSSIQIITERRPSCWSVASPPETPPTEWNSASVNIDRPTTTKLPIYRFPRLEHKIKGENSSRSFNRQQTKPNPKATASMSKAKKSHELNGSPRVAAPEKDEARATAGAASRKDGHAAESLHQLQQLQNDGRLDADEASKVKAIHEQLLANTMQVSSGIQLESDGSKSWCPTEDTLQAKLLDAKESRIISSATSFQANPNQVSTLPGKPGGPTPPHLRVQSARPGPDDKNKPLPPHLRGSAVPSIATATGKHTTSAMQDAKIPPHLDSPSTAKIGASKGPVLVTTPLPTPQKKDDYCRPTIDMDKEIAATQPVFDIDEEIAAGLRAETSNAFLEAQPTDSNAQETNEQVIYVAPRPRAASPRLKAFGAESKSEVTNKDAKPPADQHPDRNHSTNSKANSFTVESYAGALHDVSSKRKNTKLKFPSKNGAVLNGAESSVKKGKKPAREFESIDYTSELVDWEGKMNPPPVGDEWNRRRPFDPRSRERLSVIEAWREEHAADPKEENRVIVNTASADFQNGEGLAGGDANVLSPIDKMEHETRTCNDDFTQARRHQNAAEAMRDYEAKIAAKPKPVPSGIEGMTKEEKRALRRALIEEERTRVIPPNPHAPAANIYLRPAEFKDMGQVMNIYNHYVQKTSFVLHLDPVDELYWRSRLQEAEDERNPFVVAIHMGEKSCRKQGDIIRRKQENVVGFAVAADFGSKKTLYHSSVELELMVHPDFHRHGIGRTLLDRILAALNPDHHLLECAPFLAFKDICHWVGGGSRQAKAIMVNILYCDGKEDTVTWRKQWLAKYEFQHVGTLPNVGFKEGKLWVMPRCVLKWRSFADLWQPG